MGAIDETTGQWISISEKRRQSNRERKDIEEDAPPAPQEEPKPPANTDPGPDPGALLVDEYYVEQVGRESLPTQADLEDYRTNAAEGVFHRLADSVIEQSGIVLDTWTAGLTEALTAIRDAEAELNAKEVPEPPPAQLNESEPLPGVSTDPTCTSLFDVDDLALRGRRSVASRRYDQPLVLLDLVIPQAARPWIFGQKLEYQQEWRHEGFTLGELASSTSLLPGEEITIEISSFQRTRQEISQESDEAKRNQYSVEQKNTDERTCTNAVASDSGWSVSASASVSFPMASASVAASAYGNSSERAEQSGRTLREATTRATTDLSSRRAVKISMTSESGSEATTTRRLRNPNPCQTVTYNFFQVLKLYDIQLRVMDNRPMLLLPSVFPRFYGPQEVRRAERLDFRPTEVEIPVHLIEGWNSPAVFLTQYFEVDRDLSRRVSGWALRLRASFDADAGNAARLLAEGLVVVVRYLFGQNPSDLLQVVADVYAGYLTSVAQIADRTRATYGNGKGQTEQLNTNGVYVDALRGRCTSCTDHDESSHYVRTMTGLEELRRVRKANELDDQEVERRKKLLAANDLDPFEPTPVT